MSTPKQIRFTYKEVAELLVAKADVKEGLWGLYFRFGLQAGNFGSSQDDVKPSAVIPILEIGIQEFETANNLTVDVAEIGSRATKPRRKKRAR